MDQIKKNCNRCKALDISGFSISCRLGFKNKLVSYDEYGFTSYGVPLEECPKPITYVHYMNLVL